MKAMVGVPASPWRSGYGAHYSSPHTGPELTNRGSGRTATRRQQRV